MKGFILAAGRGTRLRPVTLEIPKPLLPVKRVPIITYLVDLFLRYRVEDIKVIVNESHLNHFLTWKQTHFPQIGSVGILSEPEPSGTFKPLEKVYPKWFNESIFVSNGDELKELNLKKMMNWHKSHQGIATIALVEVDEPQNYGVAELKGDRIVRFLEKPKNPPSSYINSGLYILDPRVMDYLPEGNFAMLEEHLFPKLAQEGKLYGYKYRGQWYDCGTFERWEKAILKWNGKAVFKAKKDILSEWRNW